jgi:hypothetical protein
VLVPRESGQGQRDRRVNRALGPPVPTGTNQTDGADDRADRVHRALVQVSAPRDKAQAAAAARDLWAAYFDCRYPRWREDAQGDAATGSGPARSRKMAKEEAYQILGPQDRGAVDSGCLRPGEKGIGHVVNGFQYPRKAGVTGLLAAPVAMLA